MTDGDIIGQILKGDTDKFRLLVEKYQGMIFRISLGFVHSREEAEDLTQEIFIQVYTRLKSFKGESSFSTWLHRVTVNASLNRIRNNKHGEFRRLSENVHGENKDDNLLSTVTDHEDPENILIMEEQRQLIHEAVDSLPENQKSAFILSKYDDLPQKEIADIMNITEGAVEALLQRAKSNLRQKLYSSLKKK